LGQRGRLWLNDRQRIGRPLAIAFAVFIALTAIITIGTFWTIPLDAFALEPFALRTILPLRPVLTLWAVLTVPLRAVPLRAVPLRPIALRTVALLEAFALLARFAVAVAAKVTVTITARLVLATLSALVLTHILTRLLLTRLWSLIGALVLTLVWARLLVADLSLLRLRRIVAVLIFEIDVEARRNRITSENFSRRAVRLNGPQEPEIVLGMLQIVFGQNPVTR
jgi:hypothetical protein